jgi:putative phosphoribosyl transferase
MLAAELERYRDVDAVVLAPVLGGVLVAHEVANHLRKPLDFAVVRKLLVPQGAGSELNAVSAAGTTILDEGLPAQPATLATPLDYFMAEAIAGLERREKVCRMGRAPLNLQNKNLILVDCGIHTGTTMQAVIRAARKCNVARIVAAAPVGSPEAIKKLSPLVDDLVCLRSPNPFGHVGLWYADFRRPGDTEIGELLS